MQKKKRHKEKGFTLLETLVAVAVLALSLAGPITVATEGLSSAFFAKDQITAFYLAQEAVEYVRGVRDENILTGYLGGSPVSSGSQVQFERSGGAAGSGGSSCTVSVNNVVQDSSSSNPDSSHSFTYTVPSVTDGMLIVVVAAEDNNTSSDSEVSSVTFGGSALTLATEVTSQNDKSASIFYLARPSAGTGTITVTMDGAVEALQVGAYTAACLKAQAPEATATDVQSSATNVTANITTVSEGALIVDVFEHGADAAGSMVPGGSQVSLFTANTPTSASSAIGAAYRIAAAAQVYTMSWQSGSTNQLAYAVAAFESSNSSGGGGGTSSCTAYSGNLAPNCSFENALGSDYQTLTPGNAYQSTADAFSGTYSIQVNGNSTWGTWMARMFSNVNVFTVSPGETYTARARVRTENVTGITYLTMNFWRPDPPYYFEYISGVDTSTLNGNNDWTNLEVTGTVPSGAGWMRIEMRNEGGGGIAYFDDLIVVEGSSITEPGGGGGGGGSSSPSFSLDIGAADRDRLVVVTASVEDSGTNLPGDGITANGATCSLAARVDNTTGAGSHTEMWYCNESHFGSSTSGPITIASNGADGWAIHAQLYVGVEQGAPLSFGTATADSASEISVAGIDVIEDGLVVMSASEGSEVGWSNYTSPLIPRTNSAPDPTGADLTTAGGTVVANGVGQTFTAQANGTFNQATAIAASWRPSGSGGGGTPAIDWLANLDDCISQNCIVDMTVVDRSANASLWPCTGTCPNMRFNAVSNLYNHQPLSTDNTESRFRREVRIETINANEVAVTVTVYWTSGTRTKQFQVRENLFYWI